MVAAEVVAAVRTEEAGRIVEVGRIVETSIPETMVVVKVLGVAEAVNPSPSLHTLPATPDIREQDIQTYPRLKPVKNILFGASLLTCAWSL